MYSGMIGKIEKAKWYAQERNRLQFAQFSASFQGEHSTYEVSYDQGHWSCTCHFFMGHGTCSHTMAAQKVLEGMVAEQVSSTAL